MDSNPLNADEREEIGNLKIGQRRTRGQLPFAELEMDMTLTLDELSGQFPPDRFQERDQRLTTHRSLMRGNLSALVGPGDRLPTIFANLFMRVPQVHASMLVLSPPEIEDRVTRKSVLSAISGAAIGTLGHGCSWLWADAGIPGEPDTRRVWYFDAPRTYPVEGDGIVHVARYASVKATSSLPDAVKITHVDGNGVMSQWIAGWDGGDRDPQGGVSNPMVPAVGNIGSTVQVVASGVQGSEPVQICYGMPNGNWGTSILEDMGGVVRAIAESYERRAYNLEANSDPILTYRIGDDDMGAYQGAGQALGDNDWDEDITAPTAQPSTSSSIKYDIAKQRSEGALRLSDAIFDVEYLAYDGQYAGETAAIDQLHKELYMVHNLPTSFLSGDYSGLSGESLKRILLPFYALNAPLHRDFHTALETVLDEEIQWPHIFDALEDPAPADNPAEAANEREADNAEADDEESDSRSDREVGDDRDYGAERAASGSADQQQPAED